MNGEQKFWLSVWAVIGTLAAVVLLGCVWYNANYYDKLVKHGYCETTVLGSGRVVLAKCP